jgi:hypothetical protein
MSNRMSDELIRLISKKWHKYNNTYTDSDRNTWNITFVGDNFALERKSEGCDHVFWNIYQYHKEEDSIIFFRDISLGYQEKIQFIFSNNNKITAQIYNNSLSCDYNDWDLTKEVTLIPVN